MGALWGGRSNDGFGIRGQVFCFIVGTWSWDLLREFSWWVAWCMRQEVSCADNYAGTPTARTRVYLDWQSREQDTDPNMSHDTRGCMEDEGHAHHL